MKTKSFLAALFCVMVLAATAQVPQNINEAFNNKYRGATIKKFAHCNDGYVATFINGGQKYKATFSDNGKWLKTTSHKKWSQMPGSVRIALHKSAYANWQVNECNQLDMPSGTVYSFEVDNEYTLSGDEQPAFSQDLYVYFTPTGQQVNMTK